MKTCPHCAEEVRDEARVCKHCGRNLGNPATGCLAIFVGVVVLGGGLGIYSSLTKPPTQATVHARDFGDAWPFVDEEVVIGCVRDGNRMPVTVRTPAMQMFGLNGTAKATLPSAEVVQRAGVSVQPFIQIGLSLCEKQ